MPIEPTSTSFRFYKINYHTDGADPAAVINVYESAAGRAVGRIHFHEPGEEVPSNAVSNGIPTLHYSLTRFRDVIDLLREEKPLYLWVRDDDLGGIASAELDSNGDG